MKLRLLVVVCMGVHGHTQTNELSIREEIDRHPESAENDPTEYSDKALLFYLVCNRMLIDTLNQNNTANENHKPLIEAFNLLFPDGFDNTLLQGFFIDLNDTLSKRIGEVREKECLAYDTAREKVIQNEINQLECEWKHVTQKVQTALDNNSDTNSSAKKLLFAKIIQSRNGPASIDTKKSEAGSEPLVPQTLEAR